MFARGVTRRVSERGWVGVWNSGLDAVDDPKTLEPNSTHAQPGNPWVIAGEM